MNTKLDIFFDMDGTIADLYNVPDWLSQLRAGSIEPYLQAKPIGDMAQLQNRLLALQKHGARLVICSWCSLGASAEYAERIAQAKLLWLNAHLPQVVFDEYLFLEYGEAKHHYAKRNHTSVLFDDNDKIRAKWNCAQSRTAVPPTQIISSLDYLLSTI